MKPGTPKDIDDIKDIETYEQAYAYIRKYVASSNRYYDDGAMCSLSESIHGSAVTSDILVMMDRVIAESKINK